MINRAIFTIALLLLAAVASATEFSLHDCVRLGIENNPEVHAYRLAVDEADEEVNMAWSDFLPTFSINYNYSKLRNDSDEERDTDYLDQHSDSFSCRLTQPIFTSLSGINGLKRARQSREYRKAEFDYMRLQLVRNISVSYYACLYAEQRIALWQESIERLQKQKKIAQAWVEQKLAPRLRLLEVEVSLSNARHQLISCQADRQIALAQLREWMVLPLDSEINVTGTLADVNIEACDSLSTCLSLAQRRPELVMSRLNVDMARQDAKIILARNMPHAQIEGAWTDYSRDYDNSRYGEEEREYYSVNFNVSMRLFQGGRNLFDWRRQNIKVQRLTHLLAKQKNAIDLDVQTRYQQLLESRARVSNAQDAVREAEEGYRLADKSARVGVVSLDDLLTAELRLTRAELAEVDARYALCTALVQLQYATASAELE